MILILILLDILINNYTNYSSYFFLIYLYNKPYKYYLLTGIILDFIIFNTYFYNILILSIIYVINKIFKDLNKNHFYVFMFFMLFNYITYIILSNIFINGMYNILINIGLNLIINLLFFALSFRVIRTSKIN